MGVRVGREKRVWREKWVAGTHREMQGSSMLAALLGGGGGGWGGAIPQHGKFVHCCLGSSTALVQVEQYGQPPQFWCAQQAQI